jgi:hypothetical protein
MSSVIITVAKGTPVVAFQGDDVNILIIDTDRQDEYLYGELVCCITGVNEDGTLNLRGLYTLDGSKTTGNVYGVQPEDVSFYQEDDDLESDDEEDFLLDEDE